MKESVEIIVTINNNRVSDLHETIASILDQINLANIDLTIFFENKTGLSIENEKSLIRESHFHISEKLPSYNSYSIHLDSGSVISHSFLYKGIHYLRLNSAAFVCPEFTFTQLINTSTISTIRNEHKIVDISRNCLIDHRKIKTTSQVRAEIIKNTCIFLPTSALTFKAHLKQLETNLPLFNYSAFQPSKLGQTRSKEPQPQKHHPVLPAIIKSIIHTIHHSSKQINCDYPSVFLDAPTRNEMARLSNHKISFKGFESANFLDLTTNSNQLIEGRFQDYIDICKHLSSDHYDYVVVLPWLIPGGIDLFAINYIKSITELFPSFRVLVVLTNNTYQSLTKEQIGFSNSVDILNLPNTISHSESYEDAAPDLLFALICNLLPQYLHIISNQVGYNCVLKYNDSLHEMTSLIFSSYNFLIEKTGHYVGYHVKELPKAYRYGDIVTTDNQKAKDMLVEKFGFQKQDVLIHNQLYDIDTTKLATPTNKDGIRILWASHIRPEKNPEILNQIASTLSSQKIDIDCYGIFDSDSWPNHKNPLDLKQPNLHYYGPYSNFFKDIDLSKYDLFLYTSHTDGMPNVILEAALAGLPIVTSDIGGIRNKLGEHAHYIKDTYSADEYTNNILDVLKHHEKALKEARHIQKKFISYHSKDVFNKQVKAMLNRNK